MQWEDTEAQVRELVGQLDRLVPRDGAHIMFPAAAGDRTTVGNRLGYLRLGIELLRAALDPAQGPGDAPARIALNIGYLDAEGSAPPWDVCELDEAIISRPPVQSELGPLGQLVSGVLVVVLLILLFIGGAVLWRWIFG
jgi:hypothetical protein